MSIERIDALMVVVAAQRARLERQAAAESGRQAVAAMWEEEGGDVAVAEPAAKRRSTRFADMRTGGE